MVVRWYTDGGGDGGGGGAELKGKTVPALKETKEACKIRAVRVLGPRLNSGTDPESMCAGRGAEVGSMLQVEAEAQSFVRSSDGAKQDTRCLLSFQTVTARCKAQP